MKKLYKWQRVIVWVIIVLILIVIISYDLDKMRNLYNLNFSYFLIALFMSLITNILIYYFIFWLIFKIGNWIHEKFEKKNKEKTIRVHKNKNYSFGKFEKKFIIIFTLLGLLAVIMVAVVGIIVLRGAIEDLESKDGHNNLSNVNLTTIPPRDKDENFIMNKDWTEKNENVKDVCIALPSDLEFLEHSFTLWNLFDSDQNLRYSSNDLKAYGIIKNNSSNCRATKIKMELSLRKDDDTNMQIETQILKEPKSLNRELVINPSSTKSYNFIIDVYDSLTEDVRPHPVSSAWGIKLKDDIEVFSRIISVEWHTGPED